MTEAADLNLDELAAELAPRLPEHAAFDGWTETALARASDELGVPADRARLAFPGGAAQMVDAWFDAVDKAMVDAFTPERIAALKVRERIRDLILFRLEAGRAPPRGAAPRARRAGHAAECARGPRGSPGAARTGSGGWRATTRPTSNHYSKRAILIGVYGSTSLVFLDDASEGFADTPRLPRPRIDGVMRFEKAKGRWRASAGHRPSLSRFLGRLRYPAI